MVATSFSNIHKGYYDSNEKIYSSNNFCYNISNVKHFDAEQFSEWMKDSFGKSNFKSLTALAEAVKSNKATISRLYNGTSQTLTNKPSQPNRELVVRLASAFKDDLNRILILAGYAPTGVTVVPEELAIIDYNGFDKGDLLEIADYIQYKREKKLKELEKEGK